MSARRSRAGAALRNAPLDLTDLIVVLIAAVLVAALIGYGLLTGGRRTETVAAITHSTSAPAATPTTEPEPLVDLVASSAVEAKAYAAGIAKQSNAPVRPFVGSGYTASATSYSSIAKQLDAAATLVVLVPSEADAKASPLQWKALVSDTVSAIELAAPEAQILIVGPVAADAQAAALKPVRNAILGSAKQAGLHYVDGVTHHWVGSKTFQGQPTAEALLAVGRGIGVEVKTILAG